MKIRYWLLGASFLVAAPVFAQSANELQVPQKSSFRDTLRGKHGDEYRKAEEGIETEEVRFDQIKELKQQVEELNARIDQLEDRMEEELRKQPKETTPKAPEKEMTPAPEKQPVEGAPK